MPLVLSEYLSYLLAHVLLALLDLNIFFLLSFEFFVEFILDKLLAFFFLFEISFEIFLICVDDRIVPLIVFKEFLRMKFNPVGNSLLM